MQTGLPVPSHPLLENFPSDSSPHHLLSVPEQDGPDFWSPFRVCHSRNYVLLAGVRTENAIAAVAKKTVALV
ncbi:MAG: hypothetical protein QXI60_04310, partial [Thermofilaceae archaeon]